jgi:hypothetical protein
MTAPRLWWTASARGDECAERELRPRDPRHESLGAMYGLAATRQPSECLRSKQNVAITRRADDVEARKSRPVLGSRHEVEPSDLEASGA